MTGSSTLKIEIITPGGRHKSERAIPSETPVAVEFNGIGYAVMMATPTDLDDFALGFALSERLADTVKDITDIQPHETDKGWLLKIHLAQHRVQAVADRVRNRVSESSCGLCGLKNLDQVHRPLPPLPQSEKIADHALFQALEGLRQHQPLNRETGGVHAAAFCDADGKVLCVREDVGRHNALDKLIGSLVKDGIATQNGFILMSSRCSYELVEKCIIAGCSTLVTISTATSLAVQRAREAGLRLVALARPDAMIDFSADTI